MGQDRDFDAVAHERCRRVPRVELPPVGVDVTAVRERVGEPQTGVAEAAGERRLEPARGRNAGQLDDQARKRRPCPAPAQPGPRDRQRERNERTGLAQPQTPIQRIG